MDAMNIDALIAGLHELEEENVKLKNLLSKYGISYEECAEYPNRLICITD